MGILAHPIWQVPRHHILRIKIWHIQRIKSAQNRICAALSYSGNKNPEKRKIFFYFLRNKKIVNHSDANRKKYKFVSRTKYRRNAKFREKKLFLFFFFFKFVKSFREQNTGEMQNLKKKIIFLKKILGVVKKINH